MPSRATSRLASVVSAINPNTQVQQGRVTASRVASFSSSTASKKSKSKAMESTIHPPTGLYKPNNLKALYYGPGSVEKHLLSCLPSSNSKAFIITGNSLATKTPLIKQIESQLQSRSAHAGTFSSIKQHAPVAQLDEATELVKGDSTIDTIISVGGGSPIDSAKAIAYRVNQTSSSSSDSSNKKDIWLNHIAIPTTLSASECTFIAGYTETSGVKTSVVHPNLYPSYIIYDSEFAKHTPPDLFASTGIRALDHAVELQYHPTATLMPAQYTAIAAITQLFKYLPAYKSDPKNDDVILRLYLAAYASLGFLGANLKGGLGLSHTMGYALGSPYGIPHGITSCLTLGHVVKLKAHGSAADAASIAAILPMLGEERTGDDLKDAEKVGDRILALVDGLGFKTTLTEKGVGRDQIDVIVDRATGGGKADEKTTKAIRGLVESLY